MRAVSRSAHRHGGELVFQIGTGYFGCRDAQWPLQPRAAARARAAGARARDRDQAVTGRQARARRTAAGRQGDCRRSPAIRGVPAGQDCVSPPAHSAFSDVDGLIEFDRADRARTPACRSASSRRSARAASGRRSPRGWRRPAAGPTSSRSTAARAGPALRRSRSPTTWRCPSSWASPASTARFARAGLAEDVVFIGSGRLGVPDSALFAFALGCDMINVGREAMLAIGCIQAQRCHTGRCPTGVATQSRWLMHGLDPRAQVDSCRQLPRRAARGDSGARALLRRGAPRARHARAHRDRHRALRLAPRFWTCSGMSPTGRCAQTRHAGSWKPRRPGACGRVAREAGRGSGGGRHAKPRKSHRHERALGATLCAALTCSETGWRWRTWKMGTTCARRGLGLAHRKRASWMYMAVQSHTRRLPAIAIAPAADGECPRRSPAGGSR